MLLRKHLLTGAYRTMLSLASPQPNGQATQHEAAHAEVLYLGTQAALALGRRDTAAEFAARGAGTSIEAGLRALVADPDLAQDDQIRLWRAALHAAIPTDLCIRGLYSLAVLGAWPLPELDQARQTGHIDPVTADILTARSEAARGNVTAAVTQLRRHTSSIAGAVEILVEVLEDAEQYDEALRECVRGIERFGESVLDATRLNLLLRTDRRDAAADWAIELLARPNLPAERRLDLQRGLIGFYTLRRNWQAVERHSRAALGDHPGTSDLQWALIGAAHSQRRLTDAWDRFQQLTPEIVHRGDLHLWLGLHAYFGFTEADITTALDSLQRWPEDGRVGAQILGTLLQGLGRRAPGGAPIVPDLDEPSQQRLQDALGDYTRRYPDGPIRALRLDGNDLAETMRAQLAPAAQEIPRLVGLVQRGQMPVGLLTVMTGRPYAKALIERACGPIVAMTVDPGRFEREITAARAAFENSAVVDTSALVVSTLLPGRWPALRDVFADVVTPRNVLHDIQVSAAELRRDPGSQSWVGLALDGQTLVRLQPTEQQSADFVRQITDVETAASDLRIVETPDRNYFPDRGGYGDQETWVSPLELAAQTTRPLWSDDVVIRSLAVQSGIPAFSTLALVQVLIERGLIADTLRNDVHTFVRAYVADFTLTPDELLEIARAEEWKLGAAAAHLRRTSSWDDYHNALTDCLPLFDNLHTHAPDLLTAWLTTVCLGIADHIPDNELHTTFTTVADIVADHLTVTPATRDVLHDAVGATADSIQRQRTSRPTGL